MQKVVSVINCRCKNCDLFPIQTFPFSISDRWAHYFFFLFFKELSITNLSRRQCQRSKFLLELLPDKTEDRLYDKIKFLLNIFYSFTFMHWQKCYIILAMFLIKPYYWSIIIFSPPFVSFLHTKDTIYVATLFFMTAKPSKISVNYYSAFFPKAK